MGKPSEKKIRKKLRDGEKKNCPSEIANEWIDLDVNLGEDVPPSSIERREAEKSASGRPETESRSARGTRKCIGSRRATTVDRHRLIGRRFN